MSEALLLSGGMDSVSIAYWRRPKYAITIDYGQKPAAGEIRAAGIVAETLGLEHFVLRADLSALGSGDLAGSAALPVAAVPEWWPYRNQLLVTLAAMKAVSIGVQTLMIGALATDGQHVDGRPEFVACLNELLSMQEGGLRLEAPAIGMTAAELVRVSNVPDEVLAWAHSCHMSEFACGACRGCIKHYQTMQDLGRAPY